MSKSVLISIQPKWIEKICKGEKTIEVRKARPKLETPFRCYIYKTMGCRKTPFAREIQKYFNCGKVIGEFVCNEIEYIAEHQVFNGKAFIEQSCLTIEELFNYTKKGFYCWHISELKIYDKPKELSEFYSITEAIDCPHKRNYYNMPFCALTNEERFCSEIKNCERKKRKLTRPPQSWCYVEAL